MEKGILVVSFGTSHLDTLEKTIAVFERETAQKFPGHRIFRAFTSGMIIEKLKKTERAEIDTVGKAMERMAAQGIKDVIVQPTHIINGIENERLLRIVTEKMNLFQHVRIGRPLLSAADDYKMSVRAVIEMTSPREEEMLVLMGHGTEHHANSAYLTLEYAFHAMGHQNVLLGTVESFPQLENVMEKLAISGKKKVILMPFMLVAGDHAKNDMAGEGNSWKTRLEASGYEVQVILRGLGESGIIRGILQEHIRQAGI